MLLNSILNTCARTTALTARDAQPIEVDNVFFAETLFDALPDVVFFVKDKEGRYVVVNRTLVARCGLKEKSALLGRNSVEAFGNRLGGNYMRQDEAVLAAGSEYHDLLELHLYPNRDSGWCLTHKIPLRDAVGNITGLAGISRDLAMPDKKHPVYRRIAAATQFIKDHYDQQFQLAELERITELSVAQIERYFKRIFDLNPRQLIIKTRIEAATKMLEGDRNITEVAVACGYNDHSAFTRQFKATVGVTPSEYRSLIRET
jgi:AraC-like DNA-binding protein